MELRKFEAPTLAEALKVVKKELGPEAIIISTKNHKSSFGLMAKGSVEVTAAVSLEALERKTAAEKRLGVQGTERLLTKPAKNVAQAYDILSGSRLERTLTKEIAQNSVARGGVNPLFTKPKSSMTSRRYIDITDEDSPAEAASAFAKDRAKISTEGSMQANPFSHKLPPTSQSNGGLLPKVLAILIEQGVGAELVKEIGDELKVILVREHVTREDLLLHHLARVLMARFRVARPLSERLQTPGTPRMIAFVGPTGVGKTTTIAKIAAELVINQKKPVTLATTDTFKIAAVEQLQTYANILRISLEVCPNQESLQNLAATLDEDHVVLIDTAGYGPRDNEKLSDLKELLSTINIETHLCVGVMTRDRDLVEIAKRFNIFDPNYLVVTKLDETNLYGGILNIAAKSRLPLSYFTMGQRVPEDMEVATKERVADLILNISGGN